MTDNVQLAIEYVEEARQAHLDWAVYLEADPKAGQAMVPRLEAVGAPDHHRMWVARYDTILNALHNLEGRQHEN